MRAIRFVLLSLIAILATPAGIPADPTTDAATNSDVGRVATSAPVPLKTPPYGERRAIVHPDGAIRLNAPLDYPLWTREADPVYFKEREFVHTAIDEAGGRVFVADGGALVALDSRRGTIVWRRNIGAGGPLVATDSHLIATSGDQIVGFDQRDGRRLWEANPRLAFLTTAHHAVFARGDGSVLRLDGDGHIAWRHRVNDAQRAFVRGGKLLVESSDGLTVLDTASGSELSHTRLGRVLGADERLAIADAVDDRRGKRFVQVDDGSHRIVHVVSLADGSIRATLLLEKGTRTFREIDDRAEFDGDAAYVSVGDFVYRVELRPPYKNFALPRFGRWLAGPYRGGLYFERFDGLWRVEPAPAAPTAYRLLAYEPKDHQIAELALDHGVLQIGFFGGRFFAIDARSRRLYFSGYLPCAAYYGFAASGPVMLALGDVRSNHHLGIVAAYPRSWLSAR